MKTFPVQVNKIWGSKYEVIDDSYFKVVKLFPTQFLNHCKKKETKLKTYQVKSKQILKTALEQGLYAKVAMIRRGN